MSSDVFLRRGLKISHLRLLAALLESGHLGQAAEAVGVAQPAASRLLVQIGQIVGAAVHERTGRGVRLTPVGEALARRAQRVQIELRDAAREVEGISQGTAGSLRVGSVTGPAIERVLPSLRRAQADMPGLAVEITVGPSDQLCDLLLEGRIDFAIGRLPERRDRALLDMRPIADEPVDLLVRAGHPLLRGVVRPGDLFGYDWVMSGAESLMGRSVLARLRAHGMVHPPQQVFTTSFLLTLALLQQSDTIAPVARAVARSFAAGRGAPYAILPVDLGIVVETYGLITLAGGQLSPLAQRFAAMICGGSD